MRSGPAIAPADFELLGELLTRAREALTHVERVIEAGLGVRPVTRVKTTSTIVDKLRRNQGSNLDSVQDLAGARLVVGDGLAEQDAVGQRLRELFADPMMPKLVDRRVVPSFGYRALHVIVFVSGFPVEVQVRTRGQDRWAQLMERIGDEWGRDVRYGGFLESSGDAGVDQLRRQVLESMSSLSQGLARDEAFARDVLNLAPALRDRGTSVDARWRLRELIATMTEREKELAQQREEAFAQVARLLEELA